MKTPKLLLPRSILLLVSFLFFSFNPSLAQNTQPQLTQPSVQFEKIQKDFSRLSAEEKLREFTNLSGSEKLQLFKGLSAEEQTMLFQKLSDVDREIMLRDLSDAEKQRLFLSLSDVDQRRLVAALSDADKARILATVGVEKREELLRKYPELEQEKQVILKPRPPAAPRGVEQVSGIEQIMAGQFPTEISRDLRQFGYDFFGKEAPAFTPILDVPVGPEYVIGPGDSFTIHLWGKAEQTYNVSVTRDGSIFVPRVGAIEVSGLTFGEMKGLLNRKFKEYYPEFEMSVTMGRIRTIEIFIVGEARNPGTYSVSSLSTIITALFAAGGPSKNGSLREIRLFRDGALIKRLDLYEFFIKGSKGNDVRLQPGDTIFIPVLGPVVGIAGCVKRPAIYEMKGSETVEDMIEVAGGVMPLGYLQNVVVERIKGHDRRVVKSFNLDPSHGQSDQNLKMPLADGDIIKIYPIYKRLRQVVYLEGHVKYPREYELKPGMKLRDVIPSYDYLLPEPYKQQAEIIRLVPPDLHPEIVAFNLGGLLAGEESQNLLLQDMDRVVIYDTWEKKEKPEVSIKGAVRKPGTYRLYQGMTVKDLIFQAGNFTDKAFTDSATLTRVIVREKTTETIDLAFSPRAAMAGTAKDDLLLQRDDMVYIRDIPQYGQALERKVSMEGELVFPGEYSFSEGERLYKVIERAGGLTPEAYPFGAVFQRESVKKIQDEQLRQYIDKLQEDILTLSAQAASGAYDKEQAAVVQQALSAKAQLLEKLKSAKSTGRIVFDLRELMVLPSSPYNFELRPGDRLIVPKRPDSVNVLGEVYNPTAILYEKEKALGYYLSRVGGPTENAEADDMYVVKANGSVISKRQSEGYLGLATWDTEYYRWNLGSFESMVLDPGDTIIVPKKVESFAWAKVKDITQTIYQIAVAAGVMVAAFK